MNEAYEIRVAFGDHNIGQCIIISTLSPKKNSDLRQNLETIKKTFEDLQFDVIAHEERALSNIADILNDGMFAINRKFVIA